MDKMLVVVFDNESQAYEGVRALRDLAEEGSISLYAHSVVAKDAGGKVTVKEEADRGPLGGAVGVLTGSLVGLLGGPVGVAVGGAVGILGGGTYDLVHAGVGLDFLEEAAEDLTPGKAAVVAEIEEEWVTPVDTRMDTLGGTVLRRARREVVEALIERDKAAAEAEMAALQAEYEQSTGEAKARLRRRIDGTKSDIQKIQARAKARIEATQREADAKIASLKAQAAKAREERRKQIEKRQAEIEAENKERKAKLSKAQELEREALELTKEALKP